MFQSTRHARTERLLPTTARNLLLGCLLPYLFLVSPAVSAAASDYQTTVEAMYLAYYGRPDDPAGVAFWAQMLEKEKGNLEQIINDFGTSPEYSDRYGHLGHTELVNNIYQQLLGRPADQGGLDFHVGKLDRREMPEIDCSQAVSSYADTENYLDLLADCEWLLAVKGALDGNNRLNWDVSVDVERWFGVGISTEGRLTELYLQGNQLGPIPAELGNLSNLEQLTLGNNQLSGCIPSKLRSGLSSDNSDNLSGLSSDNPNDLPFCQDG